MGRLMSYRILKMGLTAGLGVVLSAGIAMAQQIPQTPTQVDLYCSGLATDQPIPADTYVISGENSSYRSTYDPGANVFLNRGAEQGVKVGDEFEVIRPVRELLDVKWFRWQTEVVRAMGPMYADIGRLRVISIQAKTSISQIELACDAVNRGDIVRPFTARSAPAYHHVAFDPFAPASGKKTAMVVTTKGYGQAAGAGTIVYVNLGSAQGVQIGDYFRVFRYQGTRDEVAYQPRDTAYKIYGFGSAPVAYKWDNLPRQALGEGIVLRTGPNSATVLLTLSKQEIYAGDYVEIE